MLSIKDRLDHVIRVRNETLADCRELINTPGRDDNGQVSSWIASGLRFLGVAAFVQRQDKATFFLNLSESARITQTMFERFDRGEPIDPSYVTMFTYHELFDALAAGNRELAESFASHMGGRDQIEKKNDHPFDLAMGYALRAIVLNREHEALKWLQKLTDLCADKKNADFRGYPLVFAGILKGDAALVNTGLRAVVLGHEKQSKGRGVFVGTEDEMLCVWGIGAANLARSRGLAVEAIPPLIPNELLI
jgi:hypothetical protein